MAKYDDEDDEGLNFDFDPYAVILQNSNNINTLHQMLQSQNLQVSQILTFMSQINAQNLLLSQRLERIEDKTK